MSPEGNKKKQSRSRKQSRQSHSYDFVGQYYYAVDEKGRVNIPAKFRKAVQAKKEDWFKITLGLDRCIWVMPPEQWRIVQEKLNKLPFELADPRYYHRMIHSYASNSKIDAQGRIVLPRNLLEKLKIEKDVVIVGMHNHIEIWKHETHQEYLNKGPSAYETGPYEEAAEKIYRYILKKNS